MLLRIPLLVGRHRVGRTLATRRSGEFEHACTMFNFEPRHAREVHRMISLVHGAGTPRFTRRSTRNRADAHRRKHSHPHPWEKKLPSPKPWADPLEDLRPPPREGPGENLLYPRKWRGRERGSVLIPRADARRRCKRREGPRNAETGCWCVSDATPRDGQCLDVGTSTVRPFHILVSFSFRSFLPREMCLWFSWIRRVQKG